MATECFDHGKSYVGLCTWCGKQLCSKCISKTEGRKQYCGKCAQQLYEYEAEKPKPVKAVPSFESDSRHSEDIFKLHEEPKVVSVKPKGPMEAQIFKRAVQSTEHMPSVAIKQSSFAWVNEKKPVSATQSSQSAQSALGMFAEKARKLERK